MLPIVRPYEYLIIQALILWAGECSMAEVMRCVQIKAQNYSQVGRFSIRSPGRTSLCPDIYELSSYYGSDQWMEDYEADEAGELPADLKRGILSEDGLYNLLKEYDVPRQKLRTL